MKVIFQNTSLVFKKAKSVKYDIKFVNLLDGYVDYSTGASKATYQKHSEDLAVTEGDIIEYCSIQSTDSMAVIAAFGNDVYMKDKSIRALSNEITEDTMNTYTYTVPAGVTKVVFSSGNPGSATPAMRNKIFVKVY